MSFLQATSSEMGKIQAPSNCYRHHYIRDGKWSPVCTGCYKKCPHKLIRDVYFYPREHPRWTQSGRVFQSVVRCEWCNFDALSESHLSVNERKLIADRIDNLYDFNE